MSGDSRSGPNQFFLEDSDCEEKSFSQDSLDGMSDIMCGENFNTLKKGPNWTDHPIKHSSSPIEPPLEFQDKPADDSLEEFFDCLSEKILRKAVQEYRDNELRRMKILNHFHRPSHHLLLGRSYYTSEFIPFSPCHGRPGSRSSLGSSRLSSSHNSLSVPAAHKVDDSSFITQAVSHDTLSSNQISDLYNVPFDSDMYAVPVDVIKPPLKPKRNQQNKKRRRNTSSGCKEIEARQYRVLSSKKNTLRSERYHWCLHQENKRHSVAGTSAPVEGEPIHMTLQEVRHYLQTLYSSSSDSSDHKERSYRPKPPLIVATDNKCTTETNNTHVNRDVNCVSNANGRTKKSTFLINIKNKKVKDSCDNVGKQINISQTNKPDKRKKTPAKLFSFKQTLCNMFRFKRFLSPEHVKCDVSDVQEKTNYISNASLVEEAHNNISSRALPPLPLKEEEEVSEEPILDFATSIQRVKDVTLPSLLAFSHIKNEFSVWLVLGSITERSRRKNLVQRTRRIIYCNFSFGSCTKFKSQTIVEFIENAVEHSRSGRYLFFLHRRPVIGPVRVQLLHPVSRFKQVQSLQHICRFAIHKVVRRDLIPSLPLPRRMIDYLNTPHYYSEHLIDVEDTSNEQVPQVPPRNPTPAIRRDYQEEEVQALVVPNVPLNNYVVLNNTNPRQS